MFVWLIMWASKWTWVDGEMLIKFVLMNIVYTCNRKQRVIWLQEDTKENSELFILCFCF